MTPDNRDDLRYAARMKDDSGFIFMINFQDHDTLRHDMDGLQLQLNLRNETLCIPEQGTFTLPKDEKSPMISRLLLVNSDWNIRLIVTCAPSIRFLLISAVILLPWKPYYRKVGTR